MNVEEPDASLPGGSRDVHESLHLTVGRIWGGLQSLTESVQDLRTHVTKMADRCAMCERRLTVRLDKLEDSYQAHLGSHKTAAAVEAQAEHDCEKILAARRETLVTRGQATAVVRTLGWVGRANLFPWVAAAVLVVIAKWG